MAILSQEKQDAVDAYMESILGTLSEIGVMLSNVSIYIIEGHLEKSVSIFDVKMTQPLPV